MSRYDNLVKGALLHDVGKLLHRANLGNRENHSSLGARYLSTYMRQDDGNKEKILNCVRYHHVKELKSAVSLADNDWAYIVYEADNLSSGIDRRKKICNGSSDSGTAGKMFAIDAPLQSIFGIFSGSPSGGTAVPVYSLKGLGKEIAINYPTTIQKKASSDLYKKLVEELTHCMSKTDILDMEIHEMLRFYEDITTYVPSSTSQDEVGDISLYTHSKITAAIASSMAMYFDSVGITDYKKACYGNDSCSRTEPIFMMISGDFSGIQEFIYTIPSKGALKSLRGRSFYLEILMEAIIDELLEALGLTRANVLYSGGGHFYILGTNTEQVRQTLARMESHINQWLLDTIGDRLYLALAGEVCTENDLIGSNIQHNIFANLSRSLGEKKLKRYNSQHLKELFDEHSKYNEIPERTKECKVCHTSVRPLRQDLHTDDMMCPICGGLYALGDALVENKDSVFVIVREKTSGTVAIPIYAREGSAYLSVVTADNMKSGAEPPRVYRIYGKNISVTGSHVYHRAWLADYVYKKEGKTADFLSLLDDKGEGESGINRIGVLRADVDDLGAAFMSGFVLKENDATYVTLSRQAELSRSMSLFFKLGVNQIVERHQPTDSFFLPGREEMAGKARKVHIIYSGGDDVFIVGEWAYLIELAVDIRKALQIFSDNKITMSAGLALFSPKYPISKMASDTGALETVAKAMPEKDSIALFGFDTENKNHEAQCLSVHKWDDFINGVCSQKLALLMRCTGMDNGMGDKFSVSTSMLYKLMFLIREIDYAEDVGGDRINTARLLYALARLQPKGSNEETANEAKALYKEFESCIYDWTKDKKT